MKAKPTLCPDIAPRTETLAIHLLHALTTHRLEGTAVHLDDLASAIGARRAEVRSTLSAMHRQGWVDVMRMKLTMKGFALGRALIGQELRPLRSTADLHAATRAA